jgi:hypothetical protein
MEEELLRRIDFDFWNESKKKIVLCLLNGKIDSISDLSRRVGLSYSVTYTHVADLAVAGVIILSKKGLGLNRLVDNFEKALIMTKTV